MMVEPPESVAAADEFLEALQQWTRHAVPLFWMDSEFLDDGVGTHARKIREYNELMQPILARRGIPLLKRSAQLNREMNPQGPHFWAEGFHGLDYHGDLVAQQILNALCTQTG